MKEGGGAERAGGAGRNGTAGGPTKATRRLGLGCWQSGPPSAWPARLVTGGPGNSGGPGPFSGQQASSSKSSDRPPVSSRLGRLSRLHPSATGHLLLGVTRARAGKAWTPASSWLQVLCTRCTVFLPGTAQSRYWGREGRRRPVATGEGLAERACSAAAENDCQ